MRTARKRTPDAEITRRTVVVDDWSASISAFPRHRNQIEPLVSMQFVGSLSAPIAGNSKAQVLVLPTKSADTREPLFSVGALIQLKPAPVFVLSLSAADFDRVLVLAASGHARYIDITMGKPRWGKAQLVGYNVQSKPDED